MTSGSLVIWQIFVLRSLLLLPVLAGIALMLGRRNARMSIMRLGILRAARHESLEATQLISARP